MSASIFTRTALQFLTAVSPTDLISCFTFSVAFAAAARACSLRASILSCASFSAAATASSAFLARTDKSASCWESGLAMYFLHREPTGHEHGWHLPRQRQPRKQRRVPPRTKFFGASECSPLSGNVDGSHTSGNNSAETALAGWGERIRTSASLALPTCSQRQQQQTARRMTRLRP